MTDKLFDNLKKRKLSPVEKERRMAMNRNVINRVILNRLGKTKRIVHGARAQNAQLPRDLERKSTVDWDVFAKNPVKASVNMEKALDKKFRGDFFGIKEGATKRLNVMEVYSKVTGESFVDYSIPDRKVGWVAKRGIRYADLQDQVNRAKQNLKNPETQFRRDKDLSLVKRYNQFKSKKRRLK